MVNVALKKISEVREIQCIIKLRVIGATIQRLEIRNDKQTIYKSEINLSPVKTDLFQIMRMQNGVKLDTARNE